MNKRPWYCWDSSVFLDWFNNEGIADLPSTKAVVRDIEQWACTLIVPVHAYAEFLEVHNPKSIVKFRLFLKRTNVMPVNITIPISIKAEEIRSAAMKLKPIRKVKPSDSLFIACAVMLKADMLHTKDAGMIGLSGMPLVNGLKICLPTPVSGEQSFA